MIAVSQSILESLAPIVRPAGALGGGALSPKIGRRRSFSRENLSLTQRRQPRGARKAGLSVRRARALFYAEPIRLSADEYLAIERAYATAHESLAALSILARDADVRADHAAPGRGRAPVCEGEPADGPERPAADATIR